MAGCPGEPNGESRGDRYDGAIKEDFALFSDLNNLNVVTSTSNEYVSCFGFTEEEVFTAMDEFGMINRNEVKRWYDGFTFGKSRDIYNPWSVICLLDKNRLDTFWANTSSNRLAGDLIRRGSEDIKMQMEELLCGKTIRCRINEEIELYYCRKYLHAKNNTILEKDAAAQLFEPQHLI